MSAPQDVELVQRLLRETGVDQQVPAPHWSGYVQDLFVAVIDWLESRLPGLRGFSSFVSALSPAAAVILVTLITLLLIALLRAAFLARRRRAPPATASVALSMPDSRRTERDRAGWKDELEERLARGDVTGALEALWWWFARSVAQSEIDPTWTSHELLARCGRNDLTQLARALDRLLYAAGRPVAADLRSFLSRAEQVLA